MKCLHCGYCCINYDVIIVDDPKKGLELDNVKHKPTGVRCQHLRGDKPGEFSCAVHNEKWYKKTPCFDFGQIESKKTDPCRMGEYLLKQPVDKQKVMGLLS